MGRILNVLNLGLKKYTEALTIQNYIAEGVKKSGEPGTVILVEHAPVYTIGIRTKDYTIRDEEKLTELGAEFHKTNRGGLITFHGPGQLVAYPVLNLKHFKPSMQWYISNLEKTIINLCEEYGLKANTSPHTGVWTDGKKICAIGVHGSRYVTTHGLALNCNTDLSWFAHIVPCGIRDKGVTSLTQELQRNITITQIIPVFSKCFEIAFECSLTSVPTNKIHDLLPPNSRT